MSEPIEQNWTVIDIASGEVITQMITEGEHPSEAGFDFDDKTMTAVQMDRQADMASERFVDGAWTEDAAKIDARLNALIDTQAGAVRLRFITNVPGQDMIYMRKEAQARAYLAATDPDVAGYPLIAADVDALGIAAIDAAQQVVAKADLWTTLAAGLEAARLGAKRAVREAATRADKEAAALVDWDAVIAAALTKTAPS